ncbi:hypothetical protein BZA70DRAFT_280814 [Myxozyma melibiosi]|uniref:INO80 complex subunit B-like conserved region domain-containing protein n=1 Tax=Myxozyma melibiosi TaxID=54550 RepID=A0ABR1F3U3_9ASCO
MENSDYTDLSTRRRDPRGPARARTRTPSPRKPTAASSSSSSSVPATTALQAVDANTDSPSPSKSSPVRPSFSRSRSASSSPSKSKSAKQIGEMQQQQTKIYASPSLGALGVPGLPVSARRRREEGARLKVFADSKEEGEEDTRNDAETDEDENKENEIPLQDRPKYAHLQSETAQAKGSSAQRRVFADIAENDPRRRREARGGSTSTSTSPTRRQAQDREKREMLRRQRVDDAETAALIEALDNVAAVASRLGRRESQGVWDEKRSEDGKSQGKGGRGEREEVYYDDEDEDGKLQLPGYVTPPRPRIRRFAAEDSVGPLLRAREEKQWPLSAPAKGRKLFEAAEIGGRVRRKLSFEVYDEEGGSRGE